ncbi:MAG: baseplate J/gp47 family protein [Hyphomicrobium sp.]|nr:baseplate J/gp47 family protein [Hyphomicrobium sp.]
MGLQIPDRAAVVATLATYVRAFVPGLDPSTSRRSYIGGKVKSLGSALHDWYVALKKYADHEPHPQTATEDFFAAGWWIAITKLPRNAAAGARGRAVFTGTNGTLIPDGLALNANGQAYTVDAASAVVTQSLVIQSLTRSGTTAIAETSEPHYLATGMTVAISGATQSAYNVTAPITVTADNEFTYTVAGSPTTPATGSPILSGTWGTADISADVLGPAGNIDGGGSLSIPVPPPGLDATVRVTFGGIAGGTNEEDLEEWRERVLKALGTDFGAFTADEIEIVARQVAGVTRVWVVKATLLGSNGVNEGQVKVAFMRDGDADPFPSSTEVATVKAAIVDQIMTAHTAEEDVIVLSPTPLAVNIAVTLVPNTASMRAAVEARLQQMFLEVATFGQNLPLDAIRCAIHGTYDAQSRTTLKSFTLTTPSANVTVGANELPRLGTITWGV